MDDFNKQMTALNQMKQNWIGDPTGDCLSCMKLLKTLLVMYAITIWQVLLMMFNILVYWI